MSKEARAVVLGLFVVVIFAIGLAFWRRPAAEFRRIRNFRIEVRDDWDKDVHVRLPRVLLEGLSDEHTISISEILRRLDELGPGDVVVIKDGNSEVTITAQPRRRGLRIS